MRRRALLLLATTSSAVLVCCNLILGPYPNPGADASSQDAAPQDARHPEADAFVDADAAAVACPDSCPDGGPSDAAGEGAADAPRPPPPELACSLVPKSSIVVDDTRNYAGPGFIRGVWFARTPTYNHVFVFSQLASDATQFLEYDLDFNAGAVQSIHSRQGLAQGAGVQLMGVSTLPAGASNVANAALATYPGPMNGTGARTGIQVIDLPPDFGAFIPDNPFSVGSVLADVPSGVFFQPTLRSADFLVATQGRSVSEYQLLAGRSDPVDGGTSGRILASSTTTAYSVANAPVLDIGGAVYAFVSGVDADGGATVFRMPEDLSLASSSVISGSMNGSVLVARPSVLDSTKALVLAAVPDSMQSQHVYGAVVDPSQLQSLAIGGLLKPGAVLAASEFPTFNVGLGWMDDETAIVGPGLGGTSLNLVWLGPDGRAVSHAATSGPIVDVGSQISATAVQFEQHGAEASATLYVAWIQNVDATGNQIITAAKVQCSPTAGGD
jgi:hypothetical protein